MYSAIIRGLIGGAAKGIGSKAVQGAAGMAAGGGSPGGNPIGPLGNANQPQQPVGGQAGQQQGNRAGEKVADALKDLVGGISTLNSRVQAIAAQSLQRAKELSRYDGNQADAVAIRKKGEVDDSIRQSERTSRGAKSVEQSQENLRRNTTEGRAALTNIQNGAATGWNNAKASFLGMFEGAASLINGDPEKRAPNSMERYLNKIATEGGHSVPRNPPAKRF